MSVNVPTLREATNAFFAEEPRRREPPPNSRTWIHNDIHALLGIRESARDEIIVGIHQAILTRSTRVNRTHSAFKEDGENVTLSTIFTDVVPGIRDFNAQQAERFGFKLCTDLSDPEIVTTFHQASALATLFRGRFGNDFHEMSVAQINSLPYQDVEKLVQAARAVIPGNLIQTPTKTTPNNNPSTPATS